MALYYVETATSLSTNMVGVEFDTATTALAANMIVEAQDEINKYISKRYDVSTYVTTSAFATNPPLLKSLALKLSEGYTWLRMSRGGKESLTRGNMLIDPVIAHLKDLRDNKADLIADDGSVVAEGGNIITVLENTSDYSSTFDEDDPLNWTVDSDKLNDIASGRS